jgi:hypothetical protein
MSKILYEVQSFSPTQQSVIDTGEAICAEYARQGYNPTLRTIYYQFIRRDAFPESRRNAAGTKNNQQNYKWLGDLLSRARVGGQIDWNHIGDPTRESSGGDGGFSGPDRAVESIVGWYGIPHWTGQPNYTEVWVEKEALADVISRPCSRWNVRYMACKGSPSSTAMHDAAQRLRRKERDGLDTSVIYLGDHDPTGLDISRDISDRLAMFRSTATVDRIALNWDQITDDLPPSPAKLTDSRAQGYIELYGEDTWELDAMEPAAMEQLVETAILDRLDMGLWDEQERKEEVDRRVLTALADNWADVDGFLREQGFVEED